MCVHMNVYSPMNLVRNIACMCVYMHACTPIHSAKGHRGVPAAVDFLSELCVCECVRACARAHAGNGS